MEPVRPRVALLIDGDNSTAASIAALFAEAEKLGDVIIRRVYGNWSLPTMQGWQESTIRYGLEQRHHGRTAAGKNATDIALTVDAMDIFYDGVVHHFCLASSDSDYTPLVMRLRSAGCTVLIMGKALTPEALKMAGTSFISIDQNDGSSGRALSPSSAASIPRAELAEMSLTEKLLALVLRAYEKEAQKGESDWVRLSDVGTTLKLDNALFRFSLYGYKNLHTFVDACPEYFETRRQSSKGKPILVRKKSAPLPASVVPLETLMTHMPQKMVPLLTTPGPFPQQLSPDLLIQAYRNAAARIQHNWVPIPNLSDALKQLDPQFTPRVYGYKNLPALVQGATNLFKTRKQSEGKTRHIEVSLLEEIQ